MSKKILIAQLAPIMLAFFVMGYCDLIGIATNYVQRDFTLTDTMANSLSVMLFVWFLILSIPTGIMMNRIGRKKTVLIGIFVNLIGLVLPFISYSLVSMFIAFAFLGIGNTLLQVSLNPLLGSMVPENKMASYLTFGQFVKAICSFVAPIIAVQCALIFGEWKLLFAIYAVIAIIALVYLQLIHIDEKGGKDVTSGFMDCIRMLGQPVIFFLFVGILMHVGVDVGVNITAPKLMQERLSIGLETAGYATSVYFIARTVGCFSGSFIMARINPNIFFRISAALIVLGVAGLFMFSSVNAILTSIVLIGLGNSNVFSIIFSDAIISRPEHENEVSGLMIMGIVGGAIFPVIMGVCSDVIGSQNGAVMIVGLCAIYLTLLSLTKK